MFRRIFFAIATIYCVMQVNEACSCMPSHPQELLCGSDTFAALVKIRSKEYVYTIERPKTKTNVIQLEDKDEKMLKKSSPAGLKSEDRVSVVSKQTEDMERVEIVVKDLEQLSQKHYFASQVRYRVKVYEAYRGMKAEEVKGKKIYIYSPPDDGLCGIDLDTREMYLLIGFKDGDRLTVHLCGHTIQWNSLDSTQKRSVRRNMRDAAEICDSPCKVQMCSWNKCPKAFDNTCSWDAEMDRSSRKLGIHPANYMCAPVYGAQGDRCAWTNSLGNNKRRRRRRRHHLVAKSESNFRRSSGRSDKSVNGP